MHSFEKRLTRRAEKKKVVSRHRNEKVETEEGWYFTYSVKFSDGTTGEERGMLHPATQPRA